MSADKIALPAMRCANLLTDIAEHVGDHAVARDGSGLCCEVYPDPARRHWTDHAPEGLAPRESYRAALPRAGGANSWPRAEPSWPSSASPTDRRSVNDGGTARQGPEHVADGA